MVWWEYNSSYWILTAAHCCLYPNQTNFPVKNYIIKMGVIDIQDANAIDMKLSFVKTHPLYEKNRTDGMMYGFMGLYDIAMMKTKTKIKFGPNIQPINLPLENKNYIGEKVTATGYGRIFINDLMWNASNILKEITLNVISNEECQRKVIENLNDGVYGNNVSEQHICLEKSTSRNSWIAGGLCGGDSGGPTVYYEEDGQPVLIGVNIGVSSVMKMGIKCLPPNIVTRVFWHLEWICEIWETN